MKLTGSGVLAVVGIVGLGALAALIYFKGPGFVKKLATQTFNPASSENIVNQGVEAGVTAATGRPETLGGWLAELFNPAARQLASEEIAPGILRAEPTGSGVPLTPADMVVMP